MTNAEKYLKDGVNARKFSKKLADYILKDIYTYEGTEKEIDELIEEFLNINERPTLTEDERVILRNMKVKGSIAEYIRRVEHTGYLQVYARCGVVGANFANIDIYSHLFQFIKERRRIFNS